MKKTTKIPVIDEIDFAIKAKRWQFLKGIVALPSFDLLDRDILIKWEKRELEIEARKR